MQYLALRYTQRLADARAVASVGSTGDSYDNALAEAFNSLFKAELIRNKGPWKNIDDLEIAVAEYIDWFNHRRLHGEIGTIPPVEFETEHYRHTTRRHVSSQPLLNPARDNHAQPTVTLHREEPLQHLHCSGRDEYLALHEPPGGAQQGGADRVGRPVALVIRDCCRFG